MQPVRLALALASAMCFVVALAHGADRSAAPSPRMPRAPRTAQVRFEGDWARHPSAQYVRLDATACKVELSNRGVGYSEVASAPGVLAPVRLMADVNGVLYRTELPEHARRDSPYEVFDCRLVLALFDFSKILRAHDIDEVRMFSAWRPPSASWPKDRLGLRHPGGLAIDAKRFGKRLSPGETAKRWIEVERDFHGALHAPPCGAEAPAPKSASDAARELRSLVCEAADQRLFTSILTPNYNRAHANHLHLELTPEVTWRLVR